jgi:hypothetical protein
VKTLHLIIIGSTIAVVITAIFLHTFSVSVSKNNEPKNTGLSALSCDTPYPQSNTGIAVLYMPVNAIGKICVQYDNNNYPTPIGGGHVFKNSQSSQIIQDVTVTADHDSIPTGNSTVVYTIKTTNQNGFYGFSIFCSDGRPLAVGYDNSSTIVKGDFPWFPQEYFGCPPLGGHYHIAGLTGIGIKYIPYSSLK